MIAKYSIVVGIAMSLLIVPLRAEVILDRADGALTATATMPGTAGYHGCNITTAEEVPAYVFELQALSRVKSDNGKTNATCGVNNRWTTVARQSSEDGQTTFSELPDGRFRVVVLAGEAIGCHLAGDTGVFPAQSIVYYKETSDVVELGPQTLVQRAAMSPAHLALKVFPNPADQDITIELEGQHLQDEVTITLVDLLGQTLYAATHSLHATSAQHRWELSVSDYPAGAYFIRLQDPAGKQLSQKIVIQDNQ